MRQIVVVDDESDIVSILSEFLAGEGYEPVPFVNGAAALNYLRATRPALLITDLLMPGMSGQDLILSTRAAYGDTLPIVVMSASVNLGAVTDLPIQAFLSKPFDLDELSDVIERCIPIPQGAAHEREDDLAPVLGNPRVHRTY